MHFLPHNTFTDVYGRILKPIVYPDLLTSTLLLQPSICRHDVNIIRAPALKNTAVHQAVKHSIWSLELTLI